MSNTQGAAASPGVALGRGETLAGEPSPRGYLYGVQGLRTVAALMVAVYHIWFNRVSGGVDVFFVVAGYFAVRSLLKMSSMSMRESAQLVWRYLLRTGRRVLPAAGVVIAATVVISYFWMPPSLWDANIGHASASLRMVENWWLIEVSTDYLAQDLRTSIFQQFWALSIQVQFYAMFPLVLLITASVVRLMRVRVDRAILVCCSLILIASLGYSIFLTSVDQPAAYFHTLTRLWEFMGGGIAAVLLVRGLRNKLAARVLGWVGLVVIVGAAALFDFSRLLPGAMGILFLVAALFVVLSSLSGAEPAILRNRWVLKFADASFTFYLWHWPLLLVYKMQVSEDVRLFGGIAILVTSALLAIATTWLVEKPIRDSKRLQRSAVASILVCVLVMVPAAGAILFWQHAYGQKLVTAAEDTTELVSGGEVQGTLVPEPIHARDDYVDSYDNGCHQDGWGEEVIACVSGDESATKTIVVVGGSHSLQWLDTVRNGAQDSDARVVTMTKSNCLFGDASVFTEELRDSCHVWSASALEMILSDPPDAVFTVATRRIDGVEQIPAAYRAYFDQLLEAGIPVIAVRDNPWFDEDVPECVDVQGAENCGIERDAFYRPIEELDIPADPLFTFVDIADDVCSPTFCHVVDGQILMYRDKNHLTRTWTVMRGTRVEDAVRNVLTAVS